VSGADNQQERPGFEQWVVGFVDGEGCFSVPVYRCRSMRLGWQVQPAFVVVQGERSVQVLHELKRFFGCGTVRINRRHDNHREHLYRFCVWALGDQVNRIVPFFEGNPLRTAKADEFRKFATIVRMMEKKLHLDQEGLIRIAEIAQTMNHRKPSRFLESPEAIRQPALLER
jgi:LAGLIDADG DNA endonuclease family protein